MCPLLVLLQRAGDNHTSIQQGRSSWVPPLSWQRLGYALQPTDMRVIIYPSLCKHWIWIPLTYWKLIVITALTAHKMGIFLTGISAEDPKQKTSSSFHVIHSEFKTILQPLFNDPHPGYTREARAMGKEVGRENFFFFFERSIGGLCIPHSYSCNTTQTLGGDHQGKHCWGQVAGEDGQLASYPWQEARWATEIQGPETAKGPEQTVQGEYRKPRDRDLTPMAGKSASKRLAWTALTD